MSNQKTNSIKNRRLVYQTQNISELHLAEAIERIDNFLDQSLKMTLLSSKIYLYPEEASDQTLRVGREVTGLDPEIKGLDCLEMADYEEQEIISSEQVAVNDELWQKLAKKSYRLEIDLKSPASAHLFVLKR